jgi:hypothetical protein
MYASHYSTMVVVLLCTICKTFQYKIPGQADDQANTWSGR